MTFEEEIQQRIQLLKDAVEDPSFTEMKKEYMRGEIRGLERALIVSKASDVTFD